MDTAAIATDLAKFRAEAGNPSFRAVRDQLRDEIGVYAPTEQALANMHKPAAIPARPDPVVVYALLHIYGVNTSDLADETLRDLLIRLMRCSTVSLPAL